MPEPLSIIIEIASGIAGAGAAWGVFRTKLAAIERSVSEHSGDLKLHTQALHDREIAEAKLQGTVQRLEERDHERAAAFDDFRASVVTRETFITETKGQNRRLDDIIGRLSRGATPPSGMQRVTAREDSDPPPLPPMRPRTNTRPGT